MRRSPGATEIPSTDGMANTEAELEYARGYLPMWAGPPLEGGICARLLVNKHGRLITTIDFDQRSFISLGRSADKVTYSLDHPSISRLHALIVHHQRLQAFYLIDCGSAHGTYLAGKRIEPKVPVRIAEGTRPSEPIHFGGSSRVYVLQSLALDGRTEHPTKLGTHIKRAQISPRRLEAEREIGAATSQKLTPLHTDHLPRASASLGERAEGLHTTSAHTTSTHTTSARDSCSRPCARTVARALRPRWPALPPSARGRWTLRVRLRGCPQAREGRDSCRAVPRVRMRHVRVCVPRGVAFARRARRAE